MLSSSVIFEHKIVNISEGDNSQGEICRNGVLQFQGFEIEGEIVSRDRNVRD